MKMQTDSYRDFLAGLQDIFGCELVGRCGISNSLNHLIADHRLVLRQTHRHTMKWSVSRAALLVLYVVSSDLLPFI